MKYYYKKPNMYAKVFGEDYQLDHPLINTCTIFKIGECAILVVQEKFNKENKTWFYGPLDPWLANDIYLSESFPAYFKLHAKKDNFPIITARRIMWALRMKPLKKEYWEDRL